MAYTEFVTHSEPSSGILVGAFALVAMYFHGATAVAPALGQFPLNGDQYGSGRKRMQVYLQQAESLYKDGYSRFRNVFYRMTTTDGDRLMVPQKYMDELKAQPADVVDNITVLRTMIESKYTGVPAETPFLNHMVRNDLTRSLTRINPRLSEQVARTVRDEFPDTHNWTPVKIHAKMLRIVAIVSGSVFLGPELCRNEDYIKTSIEYTIDLFMSVRSLKMWPAFLRPFVWRTIAPLKRIDAHRERAYRFLMPIIRERRTLATHGKELPDDMLQWMINKADKFGVQDDRELAFHELTLSLAAIHTTSLTVTQIFYDLAARPDIMDDLREQVQTVLRETNGVMTTNALFRMKLLDSVMRESQRLNPSNMTRFVRYIHKPITFQDGTRIPADVVIEAPHVAITRDPRLYPNPDVFDPYRFVRLRNGEDKDPIGYKTPEQYQFVTVAKENLSFGFGQHACPGRFFAANEIKMVLIRLLLDFDIKMPDGETTRYKNIAMSGAIMPDTGKEILLRRRT